jgi:hypothetical protein
MGTKTVKWGDGSKVLLRCVMDEAVHKLLMEQVGFSDLTVCRVVMPCMHISYSGVH